MTQGQRTTFQVGGDTYPVTIYAAAGAQKMMPAVVLLHGTDGLDGESGTEIPKLAGEIRDAGFIVFVPEYFDRNEPAGLPPLAVFERRLALAGSYRPRIAAAVDHARLHPGVDPARLGLVGFSLGGGLALEYAIAAPGTVGAVVDFFGHIAPGSDVYRDAKHLPPTMILHNAYDPVVHVDVSRELHKALRTAEIRHEYHAYDHDDPELPSHPFRPGGAADVDARAKAVAWLRKHLGAAD